MELHEYKICNSPGGTHITATIWPCICLSHKVLVLSDNDTTELLIRKILSFDHTSYAHWSATETYLSAESSSRRQKRSYLLV